MGTLKLLVGFLVFTVFKDELEARKSLKAFFLHPKLYVNTLRAFFSFYLRREISTKGFLKLWKLISNLILDQIIVSDLNTKVHKLASQTAFDFMKLDIKNKDIHCIQ